MARKFKLIRRKDVIPLKDYGFFGPDSVTWKVWAYPTAIALGFIRATSIEFLDPNLNAAVTATGDVVRRTATRYDRTLHYFALVKFGDTETATRAANVLVKIHTKAVGTDPVTGGHYDANDPDSQLWIHMTAWHSILKCYEVFGPGPLSEKDELQYWKECRIAAELQTINLDDVPQSRKEVQAYFESWRPKVAASESAQFMMDFVLDAVKWLLPQSNVFPVRQYRWALSRLHYHAVLATYPRYFRQLSGIRQSSLEDWFYIKITRAIYAVLNSMPKQILPSFMSTISPSTAPLIAPMFFGVAPLDPHTHTPTEARDRLEILPPREEYARFRALVETKHQAGLMDEKELLVGPEIEESIELIGPTH